MIQNDTFLRALRREPTSHTPVWLMRQAGRYLPEYNRTRAQAGSFMQLAMTPELATEVTLQPLERFPLDAAILFSDILTVPDAMGLGLSFAVGEGPRFAHKTDSEASIRALTVPDMNKLRYVFDAVTQIKKALNGRVPLIGFSGSPFTLACYTIEGGSSDGFPNVRRLAYSRPDLMQRLIDVNTEAVTVYLNEQIDAGADAVMIFDTWGGLLPAAEYRTFSLASMRRVLEGLKPGATGKMPTILFTKGGGVWLDEMAASGADALGLDWTVALAQARKAVGQRVALQGNLDPLTLLTDPATVARAAEAVVRAAGSAPGHIFNLGHGIVPQTPPENVGVLVETVHRVSREMRQASP
ncbi:MAG: uroporphyrinogen decarboxylase [Burkholderiales bacterium]|jgi:uroporphyrinogen decarboxylase|nr:uroporphyrinogen decarboxylase [Burkholderiales bacterium]